MAKHELKDLEVFIVDDDEAIRDSLSMYLASLGVHVRCACNPIDALAELKVKSAGIVISDVRMPQMDGMTFLKELKKTYGDDTEVLIITGHSNEALAIEALKNGAFDYFRKPLHAREVVESLKRTKRFNDLKQENAQLKQRLELNQTSKIGFFGDSPATKTMLEMMRRVSKMPMTCVWLHGETGSGKEIAARHIHELTCGEKKPFVAINCGAIPEKLIESELFGHEKGAFTGADSRRSGVFELAKGGTVFLDEISEMPLNAQVKLLRVLEDRVVRRVGGDQEIKLDDTRILVASNRDLESLVEAGEFREDLYFRVNIAKIPIPALRERTQDIIPLAQSFLKEFSQRCHRSLKLSLEAEAGLLSYSFKGNIRELRNILERATIFAMGEEIQLSDLNLTPGSQPQSHKEMALNTSSLNLKEMEETFVKRAIRQGNHSHAARILGITPQALYRKLDKYGLR
ncbi:sigma-54 dependent transcriptional regulator [Lentisphaera profundi]|uniref:Sigma-54 dependent transcriptional regulator n=1 Tax=Lentisphaera profundi TaxID=1658616 RepID=A0ABY7VR76_9BACT|nr:sigma-54 dependent transcriptional regulator [Lentisphaera profundi]WDE95723.1 sigma-54 dependent transcriptional regulator [Lentisphaera profundi]